MSFDANIISAECCLCKKTYKNNRRCTNIAFNIDDEKYYCKACAINKEWEEYKKEKP